MANYVNSDMTFGDLCSLVLREYKEPVTGSTAVSLDLVEDMVNTTYYDIFNEPADASYLREANYEFATIPDAYVGSGGIAVGATSIVLQDSSNLPNAERKVLINGREFATYTSNDLATTLSGVTGVQTAHSEGESVQVGYPLSDITDIDEQEINSVRVDGVEYKFKDPSVWLNVSSYQYQHYTIFDGYMFFPRTSAAQYVQMIYDKKVTLMANTTDKPTLIPNKYRVPLLVSGAVAKIGVRDDMRTGWDYHKNEFNTTIKKFYATGNNRIKTKTPIRRGSVYD